MLVNCEYDELSNSEEHRKKKYFDSCSIDLINCKANCHADTHIIMVVGGFRFLCKACTSIIHWLLETCGSWLVQGMSHGFIGCQIRGYVWEWAITDENRSGHHPVLNKILCRLWRLDNDQATSMPIDEWGFWHSSDNTHRKITRSDHFLSLQVR